MKNEELTPGMSLLSVKKVAAMFDLSVRQIWRLVAAQQFPQPIHIGHAARWRWSDIQVYLDQSKGMAS